MKAVHIVLEFSNLSARKILVLDQKDPSASDKTVRLFACKLDEENIRHYLRMIRFLGSS